MRQALITDLARQLGVVTSRRVSVTLGLWGEPGIGKTHAARDILEHVPCHHLSVHATTPLSHIESAFPEAKSLPDWVKSQLGRLRRCEPMEAQTVAQVFAASMSALAPFVLHLEDIHEVDAERMELIELFAQAVARTRGVGLLVTSRAEPPTPFRSHHLEPITKAETALLLEHELKTSAPSDGLEWIFGRTLGNPLFTLEFVRYLRRQGFLWSDGEAWHWRVPPEDFVPATVAALVIELATNAVTTPQGRSVLEARALLPTKLDALHPAALWARLAEVSEAALEEHKSILQHSGLLVGDQFSHPLFGEVIAAELEPSIKRSLARRALQASQETDPAAAAAFIDAAELGSAETLTLLQRAAVQVGAQGENLRAAHFLGRAAQHAAGHERVSLALEAERALLPTGDYRLREQLARLALETEPENREALFALTNMYGLTGRVEEVQELLAGLSATERLETRFVEGLFRALSNAGRYRECLDLWEHHEGLRTQPNARSVHYAIGAYSNLGDYERAEGIIHEVLSCQDLPEAMRTTVLNRLALLRSNQGRLEEAEALHEEIIALALQKHNLNNLASSYFNRALNRIRLGWFSPAQDDIEESIRTFEASGNAAAVAYSQLMYGDFLLHSGTFEAAERVLLDALESYWRWHPGPRQVTCEIEIALLYARWRPAYGQALAWKFSHEALSHARALPDQPMTHLALAAAARVAGWRGEASQALRLASEAIGLLKSASQDEDDYACLVAMAEALELNGHHEEALRHWREALRIAEHLRISLESHEAALEIARLQCDWDRVRTLRAWFAEHELGLGVRRADESLEASLESLTAPPPTKLLVLGAVTLEHNAQPVPTRAKKRLEFLAYLLETRIVGRGEASSLELVDALYPFTSEPEAKKSLKQLVYLNRTALGAESIVSTATGYALGAVSSDAEDFLSSGHPALWRGAYLSGLSEGWHPGVRDALTLALRAKAEALLEVNPSEAARLGALLVEMEPYDLEALRLTVSGLERAGKRGAARSAYREGHQRLADIGEVLPETIEELLEMRLSSS